MLCIEFLTYRTVCFINYITNKPNLQLQETILLQTKTTNKLNKLSVCSDSLHWRKAMPINVLRYTVIHNIAKNATSLAKYFNV